MAFKRTTRWQRKKRPMAKRNRFGKVTRRRTPIRNKVCFFKRKSFATQVVGVTTGADQYGGAYYSFASVNGASEFTPLFDQYKILAVKTTFVLQGNSGGQNMDTNSTLGSLPQVFTLIDRNDATTPTSLNSFLENGKVVQHKLSRDRNSCSVYFKPTVLGMAYNEAAGTSQNAIEEPSRWYNMVHTNISHYGLKYIISGLGYNNYIDIYHTYYFACKDPK